MLGFLRRHRVRRLVRLLSHPDLRRQDRAIAGLRRLLLLGRVSISTEVLTAVGPLMGDSREWVRWNAASAVMELGQRGERPAPESMRSVLVDADGEVRFDARIV
jgi:hypothetical protein